MLYNLCKFFNVLFIIYVFWEFNIHLYMFFSHIAMQPKQEQAARLHAGPSSAVSGRQLGDGPNGDGYMVEEDAEVIHEPKRRRNDRGEMVYDDDEVLRWGLNTYLKKS